MLQSVERPGSAEFSDILLRAVAQAGVIKTNTNDAGGRHYTTTAGVPVSEEIFNELLARDLIEPAEDGLLAGFSQSYRMKGTA